MTLRLATRMKRGLVAGLLALTLPFAAWAQTPVPAQADWVAARQSVTLPSGQALSFVEIGAPDGLPLILLHGFTDNSRSWSLLAPHLPDRRIIAIDLRGHGGSAAPACCYGVDAMVDDLRGFMDLQNIAEADLVGHSLGSIVAGSFAGLYPGRVNRLVLISAAAAVPAAANDWLWDTVPVQPRPLDPDSQFMLDWYWNPTPVDDDFLTRERGESAATPEDVWLGVMRAFSLTDWSPLARQIEDPVLILWGDQDGLFGAETQDALRALLPDAQHETYAGLGHNMFWEQSAEVGALITGFLTQ